MGAFGIVDEARNAIMPVQNVGRMAQVREIGQLTMECRKKVKLCHHK